MEEASLGPGVGFDFQCVVVLPADMEVGWLPHDSRRAVSFALVPCGFILDRVPLHGRLRAFRLVRNASGRCWILTEAVRCGARTAYCSRRADSEVPFG